jgi:hypothetical protein
METTMNTPVTTTRMTPSILSIAATLALAASPLTSRADARSEAAMNTCIDLFVAANLPKEQPIVIRREESEPSPAAGHRRAERITLTARGSTSGRQIARATCIVDRYGQVVALNGRSVSEAQLAAAASHDTGAR